MTASEFIKMQMIIASCGSIAQALKSIDPEDLRAVIASRERIQANLRPDANTSEAAIRGGICVTEELKVLLFCREELSARQASFGDMVAAVAKGEAAAAKIIILPNESSHDQVAEFLDPSAVPPKGRSV